VTRLGWPLLVLLLLSGCGGPPPSEDVLRLGIANSARNLDPRRATDATSDRVNRLLYQRLVEFDARSLPMPSLATWERLTPTHYRFTLREGRRAFSDGEPLDAADVAATFASILAPGSPSPHREVLSLIRSVEARGRDRIEFHLAEADPLFPAYLGIGILPAERIAAGHRFERQPIGSGPFRLVDWSTPGRLRLQRRRDGQVVELVSVRDPNVRVMKLLRGEIDMLQNDLPPELIAYLRRREAVRVERRAGVNVSYLGFNLEDPQTGRLAVRRAIAHGVDPEAILGHLFRDAGRPAAGLFPPEHWAGATAQAPRHDPAAARAWLGRAGYGPERPLELVYKTSSDPFRLRLATAIQAQLADVGIALEIRSYDWGTFFGDVQAGRFQLYGLTWVGLRTPDIFRYAFHSASVPPDGANRGRYRSAVADRLIEAARGEADLAVQAQLYRQLQAHLLDELPYVPLWYEDQVFAARDQVRGYGLAPDGALDGLEWVERMPAAASAADSPAWLGQAFGLR